MLVSSDTSQSQVSDDDEQVYLVPYRWWKEAHESLTSDSDGGRKGDLYVMSPSSSFGGPLKIINNIFNSDLMFSMRREEEALGQNNDNSEAGFSGREYALVPGEMWLHALKWHSESRILLKDGKSFSAAEDDMSDVYPIQLRLSALRETNSLGVKISKKDNAVELYRRACKIFNVESELLHIWDFSGRTTLFFTNDNDRLSKEGQRHSDEEIVLELQIYGLSDSLKCRGGKKDETSSNLSGFFNGTSLLRNGSYSEAGSLGLTGLQNLGNTCFMNSALQCLAHTPKLVDYFLGDYSKEINHDNPLGMDGEIALAFGDLLRKLWAPGATPVAPRIFKSKLSRFAPQFSGFNQHDSQEVLAFLLDGLHEDLNRVKCKPYLEVKDGEGRVDEEVADEYWRNHLARNNSIIVDVCQGQYKSTLICPICRKMSITFDPFMYISLPLPSTTMRTMTLTVMSTDGSSLPLPYTITVPKFGKFEDLIQALSTACSLRDNETLLVAEIFNSRIIRFLEEPTDSISLIRDADRLVAYRLLNDVEKVSLVVFMHQQMGELYIHGKLTPGWKAFGAPLVGKVSDNINGSDIRNLFLNLLKPFLMSEEEDDLNDGDAPEITAIAEVTETENAGSGSGGDVSGNDQNQAEPNFSGPELQFHLTDKKGTVMESTIAMNDPVTVSGSLRQLNILVSWPQNIMERYDTCILTSLPEIFKSGSFQKTPQQYVSLYNCLEAFLKEEPLGPEDMWYCPACKTHRQATKKLDLWRLPEILVIHLKRFSYSRFLKNKLETNVDFPIHDLDLSTYISNQNCELSKKHYMLYAISNHYGSMGGGHYTAFVHHGGDRWYEFDDSHVYPISEDKIKTAAAYVLFYRRISDV